jgi:hypothetical protein
VNSCPRKWSGWLSAVEYWYNTSFHSAIQRSPFEALYGYPPRHFGLSSVPTTSITTLDEWLKERQLVTNLIKQHLARASLRMKQQADKGCTERQFEVDDLVFLMLQPYVQSFLAPRPNQKLAFKFFGPFRIVQRIGKVAYKLELPSQSMIHPVFHVSQLKKAVGTSVQVSPSLSDDMFDTLVPKKVLSRRLVTRGLRTAQQVLVKWSASLAALATWEDFEALRQRFPIAPAWGQASSYGAGNVGALDSEEEPKAGNTALKEDDSGPVGRRVSNRVRNASPKVFGPDWLNVCV